MSKIDELIYELCPYGVEYIPLTEVINYEQPGQYIVNSTKYDESYKIPVLTAGQTFILGYTDEKDGIYAASKENPVIIFDDFTGAFKWVDFPFKVKSSAIKILFPNTDQVALRYIFHIMGYINFKSDEHKRLWISTYSLFKIPFPPISVQNEIVRILDNFTELTAELTTKLTAELASRKKQYEYYRDKLLTIGKPNIELGSIGKVSMCKRIMKAETSSRGDIPFFKIGTFGAIADAFISKETFEKYKKKFSYPKKGDILISAAGTIGRAVIFDGEPAYFQDSNIVWIDNDESAVLNKYLYYCYQLQPWNSSKGGTIARLYNDNIAKAKIYAPSLKEQHHIVNVLDSFEVLYNDISLRLPAEIEARKKQYEYYRDKLVTFKEKGA